MLEVEVTVSGGGHTAEFTRRRRVARPRRGLCGAAGGAAVALEALALPAAEAPDVALDLARIDLAAREVHVRAGDQAALVALERHPLGQHVVGVGQPRGAARLGLVGELDAVLVEE